MLNQPRICSLIGFLLPLAASGCTETEPTLPSSRAPTGASGGFPIPSTPTRWPVLSRPPLPCSATPLDAECSPRAAELTPSGRTVPGEQAMVQAATDSRLRATCGPCHGLGDDRVTADSRYDVLDTWQTLSDLALVIPGSAAESPLLLQRHDSTAYPFIPVYGQGPTKEQWDAVGAFIDNPVHFPSDANTPCPRLTRPLAEDSAAMLADLRAQPAEDQAFIRYLSLAQQLLLGRCGDELTADRAALQKLLNMISTGPSVERAVAIDDAQTLYRLDIRDYGWDRELRGAAGNTFSDGWEAIASANPYATRFEGDQAQELEALCGSNTPWMDLQGALLAATIGPLYYALIGIDPEQPLRQTLLSLLQLDVDEQIAEEAVRRAGSSRSVSTRAGVLAERYDLPDAAGPFWQLAEVSMVHPTTGLFRTPLAAHSARRKAIFTLPNGFLGFVRTDADDYPLSQASARFDYMPDTNVERTPLGCSACHATGLFPVEDEVRRSTQDNRFNFNADDFEWIQEIYPNQNAMRALTRDDSARYQTALELAGAPTSGPDPVASCAMRYDRPLTTSEISAELRVSPERLREALPTLPEALRQAIESETALSRQQFSSLYLESLCRLQTDPAIRPHSSTCPPLPPSPDE